MNRRKLFSLNFKDISNLANNSLYTTSFFMAFTSFFNAGCGFLFWIIAARIYTVDQVGQATALISSLALITFLSLLGFDSAIIRFFPFENKGKTISTSLIMTTAASIMAAGLYIILVEIFAPAVSFWKEPKYVLAFLLIAALSSVANISGNGFIADRKSNLFFFQNLLMALRVPALIPLAFMGVMGIFGSVGLGFVVASLFGLAKLHRRIATIRPQVDLDFIRRSFQFSSRTYISGILAVAPTLIIPIMVLNMLGNAEAARYYIAFSIGNMVLIIPSSLGTSLFVEGSHGEGLREGVIRAGAASIILLAPAVLIIFLFGDRLLGMLKGEYVEAFGLLRIIALSCFPVAVYSLFVSIQSVRMKVDSLMQLNALKCIMLLGLSYILMQWYGILGAGYAWMATSLLTAFWIGYVAKKEGWI